MPWWVLSMSNATTMFDVSGTMWLVSLLYVYGLKSVFIPWLWPVFNQIFLMVYLSTWLRRSGALTGAEWITLRFGADQRRGGVADQRRDLRAGERDRLYGLRVRRDRQVCRRVPAAAAFARHLRADHHRRDDALHRRRRALQRRDRRSDSVRA